MAVQIYCVSLKTDRVPECSFFLAGCEADLVSYLRERILSLHSVRFYQEPKLYNRFVTCQEYLNTLSLDIFDFAETNETWRYASRGLFIRDRQRRTVDPRGELVAAWKVEEALPPFVEEPENMTGCPSDDSWGFTTKAPPRLFNLPTKTYADHGSDHVAMVEPERFERNPGLYGSALDDWNAGRGGSPY